MSQAVSLSSPVVQNILASLKTLQKDVADIKAKLSVSPVYGTSAWWHLSNAQAKDDIKNKRYTTLKSAKDIDDYFASL